MEMEPLAISSAGRELAAVLMYARQFDLALEQARKTYDLDPNHVSGRSWLCNTLNLKGMHAESIAISEKAPQLQPSTLAALSYAYARSGRRQEAEGMLKQWKELEKTNYVANYWMAITYAALGDKDAAFAALEKAYQAHDRFLPRLKTDPFMDPLRDDPRFADLVRRIGLPQ